MLRSTQPRCTRQRLMIHRVLRRLRQVLEPAGQWQTQRWSSWSRRVPVVVVRPSCKRFRACLSISHSCRRDCVSSVVENDRPGRTSWHGYTRQTCARDSSVRTEPPNLRVVEIPHRNNHRHQLGPSGPERGGRRLAHPRAQRTTRSDV